MDRLGPWEPTLEGDGIQVGDTIVPGLSREAPIDIDDWDEPPPPDSSTLRIEQAGSSEQSLPIGHELRRTASGRIYYVNHFARTTSWTRPSVSFPRRTAQRKEARSSGHPTVACRGNIIVNYAASQLRSVISAQQGSRDITRLYAPHPTVADPLGQGPLVQVSHLSAGAANSPVYMDTHHLSNFSHFKTRVQSVNKIVQSGTTIVIASSTLDGFGSLDAPVSEYNDMTLTLWSHGKGADGEYCSVPCHYSKDRRSPTPRARFHTIHDIAVDPTNPDRIVTSAEDKKVCVMSVQRLRDVHGAMTRPLVQGAVFDPLIGGTVAEPLVSFGRKRPLDIAFRPRDSRFAVGYDNGTIDLFNADTLERLSKITLGVTASNNGLGIGPLAWGRGRTAQYIFASAEPVREHAFDWGAHGYRHVGALGPKGMLDPFSDDDLQDEAGDALAVHPHGEVALFTRTEEGHTLRVFDILSDKPSRTVRLEPRTCHTSAGDPANYEVTRPSFSPDGIYLAVPRSDNTTHVYDYRFMSTERGPLAAYAHGPSKTLVEGAGQHHVPCGVVQARWVGSAFGCSRLGLLTGGDDGCVRVWDVGKSIEDHSGGRVLVEVPDDISYFTLGKVWNGQKRLVVGDCISSVWIYD